MRIIRRFERMLVQGVLRRGRQRKPSFSLTVEPTNACNLACPICPHGYRPGNAGRPLGLMSMATFDHVLTGCRPMIKTISLYLHGEPFLHPQLPAMVERARKHDLQVTIYSNGVFANAVERFKQVLPYSPSSLFLSMDLISPAGYRAMKGLDGYENASATLTELAECIHVGKSRTRLCLRSIYNGESEEELIRFVERWILTPGISSIQVSHRFPWPDMREADILAGHMTARDRRICPEVWSALNVGWDGSVMMCGLDFDGLSVVGNVNDTPITELVNCPDACRFRRTHIFGHRRTLPLCRNCVIPQFVTAVTTFRHSQIIKDGMLSAIAPIKAIVEQQKQALPTPKNSSWPQENNCGKA